MKSINRSSLSDVFPPNLLTWLPRSRAEPAWPESSINNMHDSEHFLLLPRPANNLYAHWKPLHRLRIIGTLGPINIALENLRSITRCGTPFVRKLIARGIDAGDGYDANGRVHDIVYQRRACQRCEASAGAVGQRRDRLYRSEHRIKGEIFWRASIPERRARLSLEFDFVSNVSVVLVHGFVVRAFEE